MFNGTIRKPLHLPSTLDPSPQPGGTDGGGTGRILAPLFAALQGGNMLRLYHFLQGNQMFHA
jgi:hypothetical protein